MWMSTLCAMSNIKIFAMQDGQPNGQLDTTHYIDPYDIFSEARRQGFSPGTPVSSPPSSV